MRDPERMARFFSVAESLGSAGTVDELLKRIVHSARSLAHAEAATLECLDRGSSGCQLVSAGSLRRGATVALERELRVDERPYGVLRLTTTRRRFSADEEALVDLLCIHAQVAIEKITLREREDLLERVRALVGEGATPNGNDGRVRELGDLRIDRARHELVVGGAPVHLTPSEFRLLELLTEEPGRAYSRDEIVEHLWDVESWGNSRVADAHVARLRAKIERDHRHPERVLSVRGVGYKFVPRVAS